MSEQTTLILIYHQDLNELQEWILKKKKKAYLLQANEDWSCLCVENDLNVSEQLAGVASMELEKVVLFIGDYDEYGWRCDFWENGTRKIHISIPFEMPEKLKIELPNPNIWLPYASSTEVLEDLNALLLSEPLDPTGSELFKASFAIEHLSNMSFESLSSCSDDFLREQGVLMVKVNRTKKMRLLQIVLEILQKPLEERGYFFVTQPYKGEDYDQYVFSKQIGSYTYFFRLEKIENQNTLELSYYPPYYMRSVEEWMIENHLRPKITYSNELQLRTKLHGLLIDIINNGIPWLEQQVIEEVNLNEVFTEIVDPLIKERGFSRIHSNEGDYDANSMFIYSTKDSKWRILFLHTKAKPMINIYMRRYDQTVRGVIHYPNKNTNIGDNYFYYKTKNELSNQLIGTIEGFFYLLSLEPSLDYDPTLRGFNF